ncbi:CPSF A subunit region-domain-containing protein, partial [Syncephalis pseudoplumigaleata]
VRQRLVFAGIKLKETKAFCSFHARIYPGCLAIANTEGVVIGAVDGVRKLHIQHVPLKEMPRRLCYYAEKEMLGVLTIRTEPNPRDAMDLEDQFVESRREERSYFHLLDAVTFDVLDQFQMRESELVETIATVSFASLHGQTYFVVGTGFTYDGDMYEELTDGRLLVFAVEDAKRLVLKAEHRVPGGVFQVVSFNGLLLACISNRTACLRCSIRGDFVAVGDLLRSVVLLRYQSEQRQFDVLAQDYTTHWTCSVTMLNDDTILAADSCYNLYTLKYHSDDPNEARREVLEDVGRFHLGDQINRFYPDMADPPAVQLFGTVAGMIGVIVPLTMEQYMLLDQLSFNLNQLRSMPGDIEHSAWRAYHDERMEKEAMGFIDGDLVEQFLQLPAEEQVAVVEGKIAAVPRHRHPMYHSRIAAMASDEDSLLSDDEPGGVRPLEASLAEVTALLEELARWH